MAYDTTEAVAKFLSGFQMKITNRERDYDSCKETKAKRWR